MKKLSKSLIVLLLIALAWPGTSSATHCNASFTTDISGLLNLFTLTPQTMSNTCTVSGCDDYFDMALLAGQSVTLSFCNNGGTSNFDTGLSSWNGPGFTTLVMCVDDVCGLNSEMTFVAPSDDTYRLRIGGFGGTNGTYTLAYWANFNQTTTAAIPTMSEWGLIAFGLMFLCFGAVSFARRREAELAG